MSKEAVNQQYSLNVCFGKHCSQRGADYIFEEIAQGLQDIAVVTVTETWCLGECNKGPNVELTSQIQPTSIPTSIRIFNRVGRWEIFGGTKIKNLLSTVKETISSS